MAAFVFHAVSYRIVGIEVQADPLGVSGSRVAFT